MFDLAGRTALVTGASRGIGRAAATALASRGAYVAVHYHQRADAAQETLAAIVAAGGQGEIAQFDAADSAAIEAFVDDLAARKGLHIVVANAGIALDGLLLRIRDEDVARAYAVNVGGTLALARSAVRLMMRKRHGRIIVLSSVVAESGNPGQAAYAATKGALLSLVRTLAREYGSRGITVNAVAPGFIETDMTASLPQEARDGVKAMTPLGRLGKPEDVAAAIVYLASDEASFVTGQTLRVNGGLYV